MLIVDAEKRSDRRFVENVYYLRCSYLSNFTVDLFFGLALFELVMGRRFDALST